MERNEEQVGNDKNIDIWRLEVPLTDLGAISEESDHEKKRNPLPLSRDDNWDAEDDHAIEVGK